jgi:two-component system nitrate/nitrite response regulator NarL
MTRVRILVADDHELVRRGLVSILTAAHTDWEVVAEAGTGASAREQGASLQPDVAVLDLSLPDTNGLQVAEYLMAHVPGIRILVLTMHAAAPIVQQLKKAGVKAYLVKSEAPTMLVSSVERMLAGEPFFASDKAHRAAGEVEAPDYVPAQFLLTPRELAVLKLLASDMSNKQVAAELDMSVRTAETHHANILAKLGAETLADLVRIAIRDKVV